MSTLISLFGPTSSGKSALAVELAKTLSESIVVGADSRQVYRRLTVGTGKEPGEWVVHPEYGSTYLVQNVPHFLIDYRDPKLRINLVDYVQDFLEVYTRTKPRYIILVGGTGLYVDTLTLQTKLLKVRLTAKDQSELWRNRLQTLDLASLQSLSKRAGLILNRSDFFNSRRLVARLHEAEGKKRNWFEDLLLPRFSRIHRFALAPDSNLLKQKITARLNLRFQQGLVEEVESLQDLGTERLLELGLEYRLTQLYLLGQLPYPQYQEALLRENLRLAKRQLTWLNPQNTTIVKTTRDIVRILESPTK